MTRRIVLASLALLAYSTVAAAQMQMPKPGPERKRLQFYTGTWSTEYEMKGGSAGSSAKMNTIDESQMQLGGFFVVRHTEGSGFMGKLFSQAVMGYDPRAKVYTYDSYNNFGEMDHYTGTVEGDTWTWNGEIGFGANARKMRFIAKEVSPTMYTMKFEMLNGDKWTTIMEGKSTKTK